MAHLHRRNTRITWSANGIPSSERFNLPVSHSSTHKPSSKHLDPSFFRLLVTARCECQLRNLTWVILLPMTKSTFWATRQSQSKEPVLLHTQWCGFERDKPTAFKTAPVHKWSQTETARFKTAMPVCRASMGHSTTPPTESPKGTCMKKHVYTGHNCPVFQQESVIFPEPSWFQKRSPCNRHSAPWTWGLHSRRIDAVDTTLKCCSGLHMTWAHKASHSSGLRSRLSSFKVLDGHGTPPTYFVLPVKEGPLPVRLLVKFATIPVASRVENNVPHKV